MQVLCEKDQWHSMAVENMVVYPWTMWDYVDDIKSALGFSQCHLFSFTDDWEYLNHFQVQSIQMKLGCSEVCAFSANQGG